MPDFKRFLGIEKVHRNSIKITVDLWSECNYRISENADISTVCWQSARGIYSKIILSEGMPVDSSLSLYSIFNSLRREL